MVTNAGTFDMGASTYNWFNADPGNGDQTFTLPDSTLNLNQSVAVSRVTDGPNVVTIRGIPGQFNPWLGYWELFNSNETMTFTSIGSQWRIT